MDGSLVVATVLFVSSAKGTTPIPCGGVWSTVACGTINEEESECDIGTVLTVLSVTVAQLASNASCQYHEIQPDEDTPSERYGKEGAGIWVTGTCIGIFNVCLGESGSCCDAIPTSTTVIISSLVAIRSVSSSQNQDVKSCNMQTAIILGSTIGGCLFLFALLIGACWLCGQGRSCSSRVLPKCSA